MIPSQRPFRSNVQRIVRKKRPQDQLESHLCRCKGPGRTVRAGRSNLSASTDDSLGSANSTEPPLLRAKLVPAQSMMADSFSASRDQPDHCPAAERVEEPLGNDMSFPLFNSHTHANSDLISPSPRSISFGESWFFQPSGTSSASNRPRGMNYQFQEETPEAVGIADRNAHGAFNRTHMNPVQCDHLLPSTINPQNISLVAKPLELCKGVSIDSGACMNPSIPPSHFDLADHPLDPLQTHPMQPLLPEEVVRAQHDQTAAIRDVGTEPSYSSPTHDHASNSCLELEWFYKAILQNTQDPYNVFPL